MLKPAEFFRAYLVKSLRPSDNTVKIPRGTAQELDSVGVGNHTYLFIRGQNMHEVVRYNHTSNYADRKDPDVLLIERDVLSTGRKTFAPGTCMSHEWFGQAISEWMAQEAGDG